MSSYVPAEQVWVKHAKCIATGPYKVNNVQTECGDFTTAVQRHRIKCHMTITALAEAIGCDTTTMSMFERNEVKLPPEVEQRLRCWLEDKNQDVRYSSRGKRKGP